MRILALIPARGGSKRLPGKNIRPLGGKPLIEWSIDAVKGVSDICDILVSTDDPRIAEIARSAGATVPWLRPPELATDHAPSLDAILHALDWYEEEKGAVDGLLVLQPTSPFRHSCQLQKAIDAFASNGHLPVISVSRVHSHPAWCFRINGKRLNPFLGWGTITQRSQDLEPAFALNGSIYLIEPSMLRSTHTFFSEDAEALIMDSPVSTIDIDTEFDWLIAEAGLQLWNAPVNQNTH